MRVFGIIIVWLVSACSEPEVDPDAPKISYTPRASETQDRRVRIQHLLIAFKGSIPIEIKRSQEEAAKLAREIYEKTKKNPARFSEFVDRYSDSSKPGIYKIANFGMQPAPGETARSDWHTGFGSLAFALKVNQVYIIEYDENKSPFGYHVMIRLPDY